MRRSKAPSMLNRAKRVCNSVENSKESELETHDSEPEDEKYNWGSKDHNGVEKVFTNQHKRVFNILWRDVSTKKHKTWKGDGTLDVNVQTMKAILKDETGKYMGSSTKFHIHDLEPEFQMMIGGKEIELQNEIKDEEDIYELRKRQMKNRNWGAEEWVSPDKQAEEEKKPKGGFQFKPILVLKQPEIPRNHEIIFKKVENRVNESWGTTNVSSTEANTNAGSISSHNLHIKPNLNSQLNIQKSMEKYPLNDNKRKEFICFLRPSELQQFLSKQVLDYFNSVKRNLNLEKLQLLDFKHVLQQICNHPSFVNHKSSTNELIHHIIPSLPDWSEMGPFDSGKLEFLQYFLNAASKGIRENCIILAKHANTLNMLQGLCNFMDINCLKLNINDSMEMKLQILEEFSLESNSVKILIINSRQILQNLLPSSQCHNFIIFEDISENMKISRILENLQHFTIYYLVTAFTIEEIVLLNAFNVNSDNSLDFMEELVKLSSTDDNFCYLHTKIECKCYENTEGSIDYKKDNEFLKNWQHFTNPFHDQLLKISGLENAAENIVTIFYKPHH